MYFDFSHKGSDSVKDKDGFVRGFEIAGPTDIFIMPKPLSRIIKVVVWADSVVKPQTIHYAWADDAGDANLFNQEGFPAVPFRTDQWIGKTDGIKYSAAK